LSLKLAASTDLLPSPRARSAWWGGVGGGGWMPQRTQPTIDQRVPRARVLRRDATEAEKKLWQHLRQLPFKQHHFRRQATIGPYFADFAISEGYRVLRFWNNDVLANAAGVLLAIETAINADRPPTPDPSLPQAGGGE